MPGLSCRFDSTSGENRCFAGNVNEPCDFGDRCAPGLSCRFEPFDGRDECLPPIAEGEPCDRSDPFQCDPNLRCLDDGTFTFECRDPLPRNAPCSIENGVDPCDNTHRCEPDASGGGETCVPRLGAGASCDEDRDCNAGLYCDFNQNRCVGLKNEGAQCSDVRECAAGFDCRFNGNVGDFVCSGLLPVGAACPSGSDADCQPGLRCRDVAENGSIVDGPSIVR